MQETIYIDSENILRVRWLFEPSGTVSMLTMQVTDTNGDCVIWEGDVPARKCGTDIMVTVAHGCQTGQWNSDLGEYKLRFLYLGELIASRTVKLNMVDGEEQ